jgi:type I restriction enzyme S subunit
LLQVGDVVIAMSSGSKTVVGKAATIKKPWLGSFGAFCGVLRPSNLIDWGYFGAFFQTAEYRNEISEKSAGVNINNLKRTYFEEIRVPTAPLVEQKRIVTKIEGLFKRVNASRDRLAKVSKILKRFRQSVLAAACSGRLTEDWREWHKKIESAPDLLDRMLDDRHDRWTKEHRRRRYREPDPYTNDDLSELPGTWCWASFDQCAWDITVGHVGPMRDRYVEEGIPFLRSQNVRPLRFEREGLVFIPPDFDGELRKSRLTGNEILVVRSGANTGDSCVYPVGEPPANCADLVITRPLLGLSAQYGVLYVTSPEGRRRLNFRETGIAQPHFNIGEMRKKPFPLPPLEEQLEIVRRVEALLKLSDMIEKRVEEATKRADKLTQAILAKAFRGELVPTEAELARRDGRDYEPASVLLARIRAEREKLATKKSDGKGPRRIKSSKG